VIIAAHLAMAPAVAVLRSEAQSGWLNRVIEGLGHPVSMFTMSVKDVEHQTAHVGVINHDQGILTQRGSTGVCFFAAFLELLRASLLLFSRATTSSFSKSFKSDRPSILVEVPELPVTLKRLRIFWKGFPMSLPDRPDFGSYKKQTFVRSTDWATVLEI